MTHYRGANRRTTAEVIADIKAALELETTKTGKAQLERALKYWTGRLDKTKEGEND